MTNLDSILRSRDITLSTKVHQVKAMVFPEITYGWESCTIKKAEGRRSDAFELWCWRRLLRVPWTWGISSWLLQQSAAAAPDLGCGVAPRSRSCAIIATSPVLNIQKTKIMASSHHFMGNRWGNNGNSVRLFLGGFQNHCRW